jgi:peptide chain release factor 2
LQEKSVLTNKLDKFNYLQNQIDSNKQYLELATAENDNQLLIDVENNLKNIHSIAQNFAIECLFDNPTDYNNCFIDINAGAGGTDSCDFALMLMHMYQKFANIRKFSCEIISFLADAEAGIRSATIKISGEYACGWLKNESGIHRLVRISPFNANGKRQTSFASIWAYPEIDDNINIDIAEKDLRIDTFRASGAGGQHVNKTDSAVRITHIPTNIAVQCQSDRSQLRNRVEAMKMLRSRLYELELSKRKELDNINEANKADNSWGNQIRSYVLHPYQLVKDLRTNHETSNTTAVLNGEIEDFLKASFFINKD